MRMSSKAKFAPAKPKKLQKQLYERCVIEDQMERLVRDNQLEFEERERTNLHEAKFKGRFTFVGEPYWGNINLFKLLFLHPRLAKKIYKRRSSIHAVYSMLP